LPASTDTENSGTATSGVDAPGEPEEITPVGTGDYVVVDGDSIESVAFSHGLLPGTLWELAANSELRQARKDRNILFPGDRITIPSRRLKLYARSTDAVHNFKRKGVPAKFRIQVLDEGTPQANVSYELVAGSETYTGRTDGSGRIEHFIPPDVQEGRLRIALEDRILTYPLKFGFLHPVEGISGIQQRLSNLGYRPGPITGHMNPQTDRALREFQFDREIEETGQPDSQTRAALSGVHDVKE
jgi:Putative peptidoglycan binding domain/LysM domain